MSEVQTPVTQTPVSGRARDTLARIRVPRSTISLKGVVAVTGAGLVGFVVVHMLGNLQLYLGPEKVNAYAAGLKGRPVLLWIARIGLLAVFVLHVALAIALQVKNRRARPVPYVARHTEQASLASRSMVWSGLALLAFLVYHLLHFTLGVTNPDHYSLLDSQQRHDVYAMMVRGFQNPFISSAYVLGMLFLGMHLIHAVPSMFQSLGINRPRWQGATHAFGVALAVVLVVGNISMPVAVSLGLVTLP